MAVDKDLINVTFYFSSGEKFMGDMSQEKLDYLIKTLANDWSSTTMTHPELGINFSLVTHYKVNKEPK
jgi:hypothetical protein